MTGAGGSVRLAYGNFYLQKPMAACFRRFYTAHLFCHFRDDLIQSCRGFHETDPTRACLTKKYNRRKLFFKRIPHAKNAKVQEGNFLLFFPVSRL